MLASYQEAFEKQRKELDELKADRSSSVEARKELELSSATQLERV